MIFLNITQLDDIGTEDLFDISIHGTQYFGHMIKIIKCGESNIIGFCWGDIQGLFE